MKAARPFVFVLLREGPSDDGLVTVLRSLVVESGIPLALGSSRPYKGTVVEKIQQLLKEGPAPDCVFVHRDSDGGDPERRFEEIEAAFLEVDDSIVRIGVVPICETEAWLLLDESAIRRVAGAPSTKHNLGLPSVNKVESIKDPKAMLREALLNASSTSGRRRVRARHAFSDQRRMLLERLAVNEDLQSLTAWRRLEVDVARMISDKSRD